MDLAIANLLAKGAVQEVQLRDDQFTSTLFLVQKENGEVRPVINLQALNRFLGKESFKMQKTTGSEVPTTERRLYDETGPKGCILCNPHSLISQDVSAVCVSGQSLRVSVPPIWPLLCSPSLHKNSETNVSSVLSLGIRIVIYIDDMLLLHQKSQVLQSLFAQVVAFLENLGFQVKMEKGSVAPSQCLVFPVGLDNHDTFSPSAKAKQYFGGLSTPRTELCHDKDSGHTDWTFEPCLSNRDHACPSSLQSSPALAPTSRDPVRP